LCFELFKLVPYSYYSEHNGDDSPKDSIHPNFSHGVNQFWYKS